MSKYIRVTKGGFSNARLVPSHADLFKIIEENRDISWFYSTYLYNEEQKKFFELNNSVAGIRNVTTNNVWWDIDSKDLNQALDTTRILVARLHYDGFTEDTIQINYSGSKGFHVKMCVDRELLPNQVKHLAYKYAGDLRGFDESLYDTNQLLRVPLTKNEKTGSFCAPITMTQLNEMTLPQIKEYATDLNDFDVESYRSFYKTAALPANLVVAGVEEEDFLAKKGKIEQDLSFDISTLDMSTRPKYLDESRWLLANGFFKTGERNYAMLCLAATYRNVGYPQDLTQGLLSGVAEIQAARTGEDVFSEREIDLIINQVYSTTWKGGQFTTKDPDNWLAKYAKKMNVDTGGSELPIKIQDIGNGFEAYINNFENNPLSFGLPELDRNFPIPAGTNVGILGAASSGKTALCLELLSRSSKAGMISVFASLDMSKSRMFEKLLYKITEGEDREVIFKNWKDPEGRKHYLKLIQEHFGNVYVFNKSSPTMLDIRAYIKEVEQLTDQPVQVLMIDYFERVSCDVSDDTAASKIIAGQIQDIVNDMPLIRTIVAVQPNKMSLGGGPDKPILSYTAIKGSSYLYQAFRQILAIWRPGFTPKTKEHDRYLEMAVLKNDLGELDSFQFGWHGKTGRIFPLEDFEKQELKDFLKYKKQLETGGSTDEWE